MRHVSLPAKDSQDKEAFVKVTNKKLYEKAPDTDPRKLNGIVIKIPAVLFEAPQDDSLQEAINEAGGEDKLLKILQDLKLDLAVNAGKTKIRNASTGTVDEITKSGIKTCREFSWGSFLTTTSAANVKATISDLRTRFLAGELSADDLVAQISAMNI